MLGGLLNVKMKESMEKVPKEASYAPMCGSWFEAPFKTRKGSKKILNQSNKLYINNVIFCWWLYYVIVLMIIWVVDILFCILYMLNECYILVFSKIKIAFAETLYLCYFNFPWWQIVRPRLIRLTVTFWCTAIQRFGVI